MSCLCGHATCECGNKCSCCPFVCLCMKCLRLRSRLQGRCHPCGEHGICLQVPPYNPLSSPDLSRKESDERTNTGRYAHEAQEGTSMASGRCDYETSRSPPRESPPSDDDDDDLIFQMDDVDPPPDVPTNTFTITSAGVKDRMFHGRSHFSSNTNVPDTRPLDLREARRSNLGYYHHSANIEQSPPSKWTESTKCKMPIVVPLKKPDDANGLNLRESRQSDMQIPAQNVAGYSHHNSAGSISEIEELPIRVPRLRSRPATDSNRIKLIETETQTSTQGVSDCSRHTSCSDISHLRESEVLTEQKLSATDLKCTELHEREMLVTAHDVAGCSHHDPATSISEIEELPITRVPSLRNRTATDRSELLEREIQSSTHSASACSHQNPSANISEVEESNVIELSSEHKLGATDLKWTESHESKKMITKDIPGSSHHYKCVLKEESEITDGASYSISPPEDDFASISLASTPSSDVSTPSSFSVSPLSPTPLLPTSAPSICDLPEPTKLKSSDHTSIIHCTSAPSPKSNLSQFEALRISDSLPINKSRTSSELNSSIEILPDNMLNGARLDKFHGQPGIPSFSVVPSQLDNTVTEAVSSEPGTSQTPSTCLKLSSSDVSKIARRTSSDSDSSIEIVTRGQTNDNSEEAPSNKSPKKI